MRCMRPETIRYHFNIVTAAQTVHDLEGTELPSLEAARAHAIDDARALMSIALLSGDDISSRSIAITDEHDNLLLMVRFREAFTPENEH
jgi:hypothetical protein